MRKVGVVRKIAKGCSCGVEVAGGKKKRKGGRRGGVLKYFSGEKRGWCKAGDARLE